MMVPLTTKPRQLVILSGIFVLTISLCAIAQEVIEALPADEAPPAQTAAAPDALIEAPAESAPKPDPMVTLNVENGNMNQVLKAFSLQTGKSIVIGPEVVSTNVNVHLSEVAWNDALEVILKPYGYGYTTTGKAIVVNRLDKIAAVKAVEPLDTKVFKLKYLDASDIKSMIEKHLSSRGNMSVLHRKGMVGWKSAAGSGGSYSQGASSTLGKRERVDTEPEALQKSKTFIVTDIPSVLESIDSMLSEVDVQPIQVLIEAKFMEVGANYLQDVGADFSMQLGDVDFNSLFSSVQPSSFSPATDDLAGNTTDNFGVLSFTPMNDPTAAIFLNLLQEDDDSNLLSAPKILTLNNQEATIIVGTKFPIIESDTSGTDTAITSTSLEYYENIGIQLNVVPQVCDGEQINMIVHPSVSEKEGETSGVSNSDDSSLTSYPIISIREVETQIILNNGETVVIGGLMTQRDGATTLKVPLLGDIPLLGYLFRREVESTENVELLVFLKATIIDPSRYAAASTKEYNDLDAKRISTKRKAALEEKSCAVCAADEPCAPCGTDAPDDELMTEEAAETAAPAAEEETPAETVLIEVINSAEEPAPAAPAAATEVIESEPAADVIQPADEAEAVVPEAVEAPDMEETPALETPEADTAVLETPEADTAVLETPAAEPADETPNAPKPRWYQFWRKSAATDEAAQPAAEDVAAPTEESLEEAI